MSGPGKVARSCGISAQRASARLRSSPKSVQGSGSFDDTVAGLLKPTQKEVDVGLVRLEKTKVGLKKKDGDKEGDIEIDTNGKVKSEVELSPMLHAVRAEGSCEGEQAALLCTSIGAGHASREAPSRPEEQSRAVPTTTTVWEEGGQEVVGQDLGNVSSGSPPHGQMRLMCVGIGDESSGDGGRTSQRPGHAARSETANAGIVSEKHAVKSPTLLAARESHDDRQDECGQWEGAIAVAVADVSETDTSVDEGQRTAVETEAVRAIGELPIGAAEDAVALPQFPSIVEQIADKLAAALHASASTQIGSYLLPRPSLGDKYLVVQLKPEDLGAVEVRLRMTGANLEVEIAPDTAETGWLLSNSRSDLGDALARAGYAVGKIHVCEPASAEEAVPAMLSGVERRLELRRSPNRSEADFNSVEGVSGREDEMTWDADRGARPRYRRRHFG